MLAWDCRVQAKVTSELCLAQCLAGIGSWADWGRLVLES